MGILSSVKTPAANEVRLIFEPKPDITTFELAQILSMCDRLYGMIVGDAEKWDAVPPELKRHFTLYDPFRA